VLTGVAPPPGAWQALAPGRRIVNSAAKARDFMRLI
jgi:hypothetical protein